MSQNCILELHTRKTTFKLFFFNIKHILLVFRGKITKIHHQRLDTSIIDYLYSLCLKKRKFKQKFPRNTIYKEKLHLEVQRLTA